MRYAIIGDIHANGDALDRVMEDLGNSNIDETVCLGDIVGYGAEPVRCLETIRDLDIKVIGGNHDWAAIGRITIDFFNAYAKTASIWTRDHLDPEHKEWLAKMPLTINLDDFAITHGTFHQPENFNYIQTVFDAQLSFGVIKSLGYNIGFLGHSHVPVCFFDTEPITYTLDAEVDVPQDKAMIVNAGSVGQPRDENPQASYAIYDTDAAKVYIRRLDYDVDAAANKIREAGLPEILAARLYHGK